MKSNDISCNLCIESMKPYHIFSVLISIVAVTMMSLSAKAAVPYTEEAEAFIGTWISPQSYYEDENQIKITQQGEHMTLRMKSRPSRYLIEEMGLSDTYDYDKVMNLTFQNGIFSWEQPVKTSGVHVYWSLQFKGGDLILHRHGTVPEDNYHTHNDYIMYPKDDF